MRRCVFALTPLLTAVGNYFIFNEKISKRLWFAIFLGMTGMVWMIKDGLTSGAHDGDVLGFLSTACFAGYILSGKDLRNRIDNLEFTFFAYSLVGLYFGLTIALGPTPFFGYETSSWGALLLLAFGPTLLGHAVFTYCLNFLDVNFMTCATLLEPIFAAGVAAILFNEPVSPATLTAFALISLGVLLVYRPNLKHLMK
jgi:drug/metabolite transporter (DMT)-like permease